MWDILIPIANITFLAQTVQDLGLLARGYPNLVMNVSLVEQSWPGQGESYIAFFNISPFDCFLFARDFRNLSE